MVEEIKGIEAELMETLKDLREKIGALETEKASLLSEIEQLKKTAGAKVTVLEQEVVALKDEAETLRKLLD